MKQRGQGKAILFPAKEIELRRVTDQTAEWLMFYSSAPDNQNAPDLSMISY